MDENIPTNPSNFYERLSKIVIKRGFENTTSEFAKFAMDHLHTSDENNRFNVEGFKLDDQPYAIGMLVCLFF